MSIGSEDIALVRSACPGGGGSGAFAASSFSPVCNGIYLCRYYVLASAKCEKSQRGQRGAKRQCVEQNATTAVLVQSGLDLLSLLIPGRN